MLGVIAGCHCRASLQGVAAGRHCRASLQGFIAGRHCLVSLLGVIAGHRCRTSLPGVIAWCCTGVHIGCSNRHLPCTSVALTDICHAHRLL